MKKNDKEIWKPVVGFEDTHKVSSKGRVKSLSRIIKNAGHYKQRKIKERIRKPYTDNLGYKTLTINIDGESYFKPVHRLVAKAFIPNPKNKPQVNHIDCNPSNNNVDNLEWVTAKENLQHASENDLLNSRKGQSHGMSTLTENDVIEMRNAYRIGCFTLTELSDAYNTSVSNVHRIINRKRWKHI